MSAPLEPTPFAEINAFLSVLQRRVGEVLGRQLVGIYVVGSLAVGDFDPASSDIDLVVVTRDQLGASQVDELKTLHARFAAEASPWAKKLEVVYAPRPALRVSLEPFSGHVPQLEKGTALFTALLEDGWVFQCWTLRERGVVVCGPPPEELGILTTPQAMAAAVRTVAAQWRSDAANDPTWLSWLRERKHQAFVVQTLCRLHYSLATGEVASKPHALIWAVRALPEPWAGFIRQTVGGQPEILGDAMLEATLEFIRYTYEMGSAKSSLVEGDRGPPSSA